MRQRRLKADPGLAGAVVYHCVSRVVDRRFIFQPQEKERFVSLMREYEAFCGVTVLTYCIMSNHFHILVQVPKPPASTPSAEVILQKLARLSGNSPAGSARQELERLRTQGDTAGEKLWIQRFARRMWDVSWFMKLVKQRFTQWYNARSQRTGTLWEERFKGVVVEGEGRTLVTMAGYIDLNPVRAGLVADPKDYRWSGYGEAVAGGRLARSGLGVVVQALRGRAGDSRADRQILEDYRVQLFGQGHESGVGSSPVGTPAKQGLKHDEVLQVLAARGRLPRETFLRCRVRYFCDGAILGSREFVETMFAAHRWRFGRKRTSGARRIRGLVEPLYSVRNLQLDVFG